ncbi:TetR/AcrR family transcriptional regulator [Isoptericola sp. NPDC057391]|uniref:TetR/AcrR family transcriptional regulator n=1 Tax=Isoptericola sp. NPDC057391 TaxID=3346117 RepID=UPI003633A40F
MTTSTRAQILDSAVNLLRDGETVSLESAARSAGVSKPGLMYHFRTKQDLMTALVDHVIDGWEEGLERILGGEPATASPRERIAAYLRWTLEVDADPSHLAMLADLRLRDALVDRWTRRMARWVTIPDDVEPGERTRLTALRLLADGAWFAEAAHYFPLTSADRDALRRLAAHWTEDAT